MIWLGTGSNQTVVRFEHYPNGEVGIQHLGLKDDHTLDIAHIKWRYDNDGDILQLIFLKNHLEFLNYAYEYVLTIPYMPYSRLDRQDKPTTAFTLRYVANLINDLNFDRVIVWEPHSLVTLDLLENSELCLMSPKLFKWVTDGSRHNMGHQPYAWPDGSIVCLPDQGAKNRYSDTLRGYEIIVGEKTRDFTTGKITGLTIPKPEGWQYRPGARAVIVDDLCSRGGTFIEAGNILRKQFGFEKVDLVVTHLEENVHSGGLFKSGSPIDHVFTSDAMDPTSHYGHRNISIYQLD